MKISIFGTRSGTEPTDGRQQTALSITVEDKIYWFDAGESCSETASKMGLDLLKLSSVFISHPHIDHTGGLVKLIWNVIKIAKVKKVAPLLSEIPVFCPCDDLWSAVKTFYIADCLEEPKFFTGKTICDGKIFDDGKVKVFALHNLHMPVRKEGFVSYSFLIEAEGKRILYSGDVKDISDFTPLLNGGVDILLMETGHHDAMEVCRRIKETGLVKKVIFLHHHRKTVENFTEYTSAVKNVYGSFIKFSNDGDEFIV